MGSNVTAQRIVLNFGMYIVMMTPTTILAPTYSLKQK